MNLIKRIFPSVTICFIIYKMHQQENKVSVHQKENKADDTFHKILGDSGNWTIIGKTHLLPCTYSNNIIHDMTINTF